jgi:hypothetical protein
LDEEADLAFVDKKAFFARRTGDEVLILDHRLDILLTAVLLTLAGDEVGDAVE